MLLSIQLLPSRGRTLHALACRDLLYSKYHSQHIVRLLHYTVRLVSFTAIVSWYFLSMSSYRVLIDVGVNSIWLWFCRYLLRKQEQLPFIPIKVRQEFQNSFFSFLTFLGITITEISVNLWKKYSAREAMCVLRNVEARSLNDCCRGTALSITHSECVSEVLRENICVAFTKRKYRDTILPLTLCCC